MVGSGLPLSIPSVATAVSSSEDGDSVPGFPAIIALASILGAIVVSRKEE